MTPSTLTQFLLIVTFIVPGIVYQTVRARYLGDVPQNQDLAAKVLRALAASTFLALLYVIALTEQVTSVLSATPEEALDYSQDNAGACARWIISLVFVIPAVLAWAVSRWPWLKFRGVQLLGWLGRKNRELVPGPVRQWGLALETRTKNPTGLRFDSTPTAWDWAIDHGATDRGFVRVLDAEGQWWGGAFGGSSYFSTFPEEPAIYVEAAWTMSAEGVFVGEQTSTKGAWIPCKDARVVQFVSPPAEV